MMVPGWRNVSRLPLALIPGKPGSVIDGLMNRCDLDTRY